MTSSNKKKPTNFSYLFQTFKLSMVRITVYDENGDLRTGAGFHIGDGWLVTAAHVTKGKKIHEVVSEHCNQCLEIENILYCEDDKIDIALLKSNIDLSHYMEMTSIHNPPAGFSKEDHLLIGGHLDDWIGDELVLTKVLLMGYPPVPFADEAVLLAVEGEVNAVVDKYNGPHPHFIISCMGRGGFSGGPVISEYGFLLGVMTESLVRDNQRQELGYSAAISIEPLLVLLHKNGIYPGKNREIVEALIEGAGT